VHFDPGVLHLDSTRRRLLLDVAGAALEAADPAAAVRRAVRRDGAAVAVGNDEIPIPPQGVVLLGLGKAAIAMTRAAAEVLRGVPLTGVVATNRPGPVPAGIEVIVGGHPLPDEGSERGGRRLLEAARGAGGRLVVTLVSGGGSALAEVPAPGVSLSDLVAVNDALIRSGAPIGEINVVRKHLSAIKGGRLAAAAGRGPMITLVVSDVVGNPLDLIASGPTVPDPSTYRDALAILAGHRIVPPPAVARLLERGGAGEIADTPSGGELLARQAIRIVADGPAAADGACRAARERGIEAKVSTTSLAGEARRVGAAIGAELRVRTREGLTVLAGETTVTVTGGGSGGRNQELALAAGIALEGDPDGIVLAFGTDGIDGPTTAAGGIGDGTTVARGRGAGRDAAAALDDNDAGGYLEAIGDRVVCGPTGTNVGDLVLAYRSGGSPD
jgi:hydroxypyruvate reductase